MDIGAACSQLAIFPVNGCVAWLRNWIVRVPLSLRIFANHTGLRVLLASEVFKLGDSSKAKVIGIINDGCGLKLLAIQRAVLKLK